MAKRELPSPELLRKLLRYEPETGKLFWLPRDREFFNSDGSWKAWNTRFANKEAFSQAHNQGYLMGGIFKQSHLAHRIIWALQTGEWPVYEVDHSDRNRKNNIWENLRAASATENTSNRCSRKNSTSKYLGVNWSDAAQKWLVRIRKNRFQKYIGIFNCEIEAAKAYDAAAKEIHGQFANLNFPGR